MKTAADTIKEITRKHLLEDNGLLLGQTITAVGWVGGTVPELTEEQGIIELSTADVAGGGISVGVALSGRRPIYVVRYQGFQWYDAASVVNYAAKSKEMWGIPCPIFVRSIAMDGGIGPVASGSHHSMFTRMPGIPVCAPMTPNEYQMAWDHFISHDDPLYVSEHRRSFKVDFEMPDQIHPDADITLYPISSTRLNAIEAAVTLAKEGIIVNIVHLFWLKPMVVDDRILAPLSSSKYGGVVIDGDFKDGVVKTIAYDILSKANKPVGILSLDERVAGFPPRLDNLPPSPEKICAYVRGVVKK
ncbi:MAG: hypothetical protein Q7R62_03760 [bacterium]|nr:hypothetical protein [bacterium]